MFFLPFQDTCPLYAQLTPSISSVNISAHFLWAPNTEQYTSGGKEDHLLT